jgi:hypothetical protein
MEVSEGHLTPRGIVSGTDLRGGSVPPKIYLDAVEKKKSLDSSENRTPNVQHLAYRYTDWAISARFEL